MSQPPAVPDLPAGEFFHFPNPKDILHDVEQDVDKAKDAALSALKDAEKSALGGIHKAQAAAEAAITKAGNAELADLHGALAELAAAKKKIKDLDDEVLDIAQHVKDSVLQALEKAAAKVAGDAIQAAVDLIEEMHAAGIKGPSFGLQLGIVSCTLGDPIGRIDALKDAIKDGIHGYAEIKDVVRAVVPDDVTLAFSAEIEFLVVSSNALEAALSVTVSEDDMEKALDLFLKRLGLL